MDKTEFADRILAMREMLYRVSYSILPNPHDQDDAVQECIKRALIKRETLRNDAHLKTWITRILINECNQIHRKRRRELPMDELPAALPPTANPALVESLLRLDVKYRTPVVLHYIEGYATHEVAEIMRIPAGTVRWRLSKAREKLREYLAEELIEP